MKTYLLIPLLTFISYLSLNAQNDPYLWLEEIGGARSLAFVKKLNEKTIDRLSKVEEYQDIYDKSLEIYNSTDKIAYPEIYGEYVYNLWKDKDHIRGIWRRATKQNYNSGDDVIWETLLDLDEMSKKDNEKWVFKGVSALYPSYNLFLVQLSKGGGDATIIKEFDVSKKMFVENGFSLEEAKGIAEYLDENTLIVSRSNENSMTTSGYARRVKIWKRGTAFKEAQLIYDGEQTDLGSWTYQIRDGYTKYTIVWRRITFFSYQSFVWLNNKLIKLDIPGDSYISGILKNQLIFDLKSDWNVNGINYNQGSVISLDFNKLLEGIKEVRLILKPDEFSSIDEIATTKNKLLINVLTNVKNELYTYSFEQDRWLNQKVDAPDFGSLSVVGTDENTDQYYFDYQNFLIPTTLFIGDAQNNTIRNLKSLPQYFDGSKYKVEQFKAKSKDGTLIPYFVVSSKLLKLDGKNSTLLYAYGGFEFSRTPFYLGAIGSSWLENNGVYVLANIRGGGEFGPKWHQAGLKEKRQNVYDDFHAVAEDLITRKITSNKKLGITGDSNGGLLVGVAFTQRPDLYNAVVCQVPLLDMKRYNKLLAGASWMDEYGNPDKTKEWEYIKKYSPYHNLKKGIRYPEVFFYTSTKDDRVHPGHARKMAAKMIDLGHPVLFYENTEGGHTGPSTNEQKAKFNALQYSYLLMKLK
ncbi:MAG TPA: prolyl oligopeptidase family serine peptidase [Chitinophagaceae bacterium]|nr:prolyl oligopeptidase family serine peptidase [Chitinophagaceae bacterium]